MSNFYDWVVDHESCAEVEEPCERLVRPPATPRAKGEVGLKRKVKQCDKTLQARIGLFSRLWQKWTVFRRYIVARVTAIVRASRLA